MDRRAVTRTLGGPAALACALLCACGDGGGTVAVQPHLDAPVRALDFGEVPVLVEREASLVLQNLGRAPLTLEAVSVEPSGGAFRLVEAPQSLGAGETGAVRIAFEAERLAQYTAIARIQSDDPDEPLVEVALSGSGSTVGRIEAPERLEFAGVCEGGEQIRRIRLRSTGTADLVIERIAFSEETPQEYGFASSTRTPVTVPVGQELLIAVRYAPGEGAPAAGQGRVVIDSADPDRRTVEVALSGSVNRAPVADIAELPICAPGQIVALDGRSSRDPDGGEPLAFAWSLKSSPIGSTARPTPGDAAETSLALDLPGEYAVLLEVSDAQGCRSRPALREVVARPAQKLLVELVWDNQSADLDLHLAPEGEEFFGPRDCYYAEGHESPDWGIAGSSRDDPRLSRDALSGFGPEIVSYPEPAPGRYRVMAHYYSAHEAETPATVATVRVYVFGALRREERRSLAREGLKWTALSIDWPSGEIAGIDTLE